MLFLLGKKRGENMRLIGRQKIFCDEPEITRENIIEVLQKAYAKHRQNVLEMQFLIDYERGIQPLQRQKNIRPDIDIRTNSSLPNYIKKFKLGYHWGSPVMLVQRGNKELHNTNSDTDDSGISSLNEVLKNGENIGFKDQQMAEFIEICGIGHRMVEPKSFPSNVTEIPESLVNIYTLDSRYAFVVYYNGPGQRELMGVSFSKRKGKNLFTCFTDTTRFEIESGEIKSENPNLLGMIPIVEYERSVDRTGCFERKIPEIDALNILESDFANDVSQRTQEMWWGDNVDFKEDEQGNPITPKSGQWILTYSADGKVAKIQPLSSTFDGTSTLNAISNKRTAILKDCFVPIQYDSSGGGSTGTATDMSAGWSAAELDALQEQQMTENGKRKELELVLKAISLIPTRVLPEDNPIRKVHSSDCDLHYNRRKNYDLVNKANFVVQLLAKGFNGRHVIKEAEIFPDAEAVWLDSKDMIEAIQKSLISGGSNQSTSGTDNTRISADNSDQRENSPILDGMNTSRSKQAV